MNTLCDIDPDPELVVNMPETSIDESVDKTIEKNSQTENKTESIATDLIKNNTTLGESSPTSENHLTPDSTIQSSEIKESSTETNSSTKENGAVDLNGPTTESKPESDVVFDVSQDKTKTEKTDTEVDEKDDLLLVIDEKQTTEGEGDCMKNVALKVDPEIQKIESATTCASTPTTEKSEPNNTELIDIGENVVGTSSTVSPIPQVPEMVATEPKRDPAPPVEKDNNKENEAELLIVDDKVEAMNGSEKIITPDAGLNTRAKRRKREQEGSATIQDSKRFKSNNNFGIFMLDRTLKNMSREKLESIILQKVCEALVYKQQIAEQIKLNQDKENVIDALRKDIMTLTKQEKDLRVVHEKIMTEIQRFKKNHDKPILIPRITRSVGLQVIMKDLSTNSHHADGASLTRKNSAVSPKQTSKMVNGYNATALPRTSLKAQLPPSIDLLPVSNKQHLSPKQKSNSVIKSPSKNGATKASKESGGTGVIDLTSEEITQPPNPQKYFTINGQSVMVQVEGSNNANIGSGTTISLATQTTQTVLRSTNTHFTPAKMNESPLQMRGSLTKSKHPAPFPKASQPKLSNSTLKPVLPRPALHLTRTRCGSGIVLCWKMPGRLELHEEIAGYQVFAYQETDSEPSSDNWAKIGDIKAMPLPMAVTLTKFKSGDRYYFAVRAVDVLTRVSAFSNYQMISL